MCRAITGKGAWCGCVWSEQTPQDWAGLWTTWQTFFLQVATVTIFTSMRSCQHQPVPNTLSGILIGSGWTPTRINVPTSFLLLVTTRWYTKYHLIFGYYTSSYIGIYWLINTKYIQIWGVLFNTNPQHPTNQLPVSGSGWCDQRYRREPAEICTLVPWWNMVKRGIPSESLILDGSGDSGDGLTLW